MDLRILNEFREELRAMLHDGVKHEHLPVWLEDCKTMEEAEERCIYNLVQKLVKMAVEE